MDTRRELDCGCVVVNNRPEQMCTEMKVLDAAYRRDPHYPNGSNCQDHLIGGVAPILVCFDDQFAEDGTLDPPPFRGWTNGTTWNGWACPMFEKDEADRVIAYINRDGWNAGHPAYYDAERDAYVVDDGQCEPADPDVWTALEFNGKTVYDIGAGYWCWNDVTFMAAYPEMPAVAGRSLAE